MKCGRSELIWKVESIYPFERLNTARIMEGDDDQIDHSHLFFIKPLARSQNFHNLPEFYFLFPPFADILHIREI